MGFYSVIAIAKHPIAFPDPFLLLDTGRNVFTVLTDDFEDFRTKLSEEGAEVIESNRLDEHQALDPRDTLMLTQDEMRMLIDAPKEDN